MSHRSERPLDLVVFGATSFVGEILCRYLVDRHGVDGSLRWAIAGRSESKLDDVAARTGAEVERIVADASERGDMDALVGRTRVVVSTVGPYALYGSDLVAAAAAAGTDYCDLTGEPQWMRSMIDAHSATAVATGARIVHSCGFDSIPSDLGVWFTQQQAISHLGQPCAAIDMRVKAMKGGASGGTIASMVNLVEEMTSNPDLRRELANPYSIAPEGMRSGVRQPDVTHPMFDPAADSWIAPFVMAAVNTRIVHRTHALLGRPWGEDFRYGEALQTGAGPSGAGRASGVVAGLGGFGALVALGPTRSILARYVLPQPGEGPSVEAQQAGRYDLRFFGTTADGGRIRTRVTGDRDPGYGSTAKMLGEAAVMLVDLPHEQIGGGFWTPATALGDDLIERLESHAGLRFSLLNASESESVAGT